METREEKIKSREGEFKDGMKREAQNIFEEIAKSRSEFHQCDRMCSKLPFFKCSSKMHSPTISSGIPTKIDYVLLCYHFLDMDINESLLLLFLLYRMN